MQKRAIIGILLVLGVIVSIIWGTMVIPAYRAESQLQKREKKRKIQNAIELKKLNNLTHIQTQRLLRTLAWAEKKNLSHAEEIRYAQIEEKACNKEFWITVGSDFKIPFNPKALVER